MAQEGIPVWEKRITRSRRSDKSTIVAKSYNSHWEIVSGETGNLYSYQIIKELKNQGEI